MANRKIKKSRINIDFSKVIIALLIVAGLGVAIFLVTKNYKEYIWRENRQNQNEAINACFEVAILDIKDSDGLVSENFNQEIYKLCMEDKGYQAR